MKKISDLVLYADEGYNSFPSIVRAGDGSYLLAFRHARHPGGSHLDPTSATWMIRSTDGCQTWGAPREIPRPDGFAAQDPVLNVLDDGTVLLTVFFWRFTEAARKPALERLLPNGGMLYETGGLTAYCGGAYCYRSRDNGDTWDGPHLITENYSLRGRCAQLPGGRVLAPVYDNEKAALFASGNGGLTWEPYALASGPLGQSRQAEEPSLFRTASGKIVCFIRTNDGMYYCESHDGGKTFGEATATGLPGRVPYDALQLPGGNVLLTYGHRCEPFGIRATLLDGECTFPGREIILRDDGLGSDLSYTSSAVLPGGEVLAAYYFYTNENDQRRYIAGTRLS